MSSSKFDGMVSVFVKAKHQYKERPGSGKCEKRQEVAIYLKGSYNKRIRGCFNIMAVPLLRPLLVHVLVCLIRGLCLAGAISVCWVSFSIHTLVHPETESLAGL